MRLRRKARYTESFVSQVYAQSTVSNLHVFKVRLSNTTRDLLAKLKQVAYTKVLGNRLCV